MKNNSIIITVVVFILVIGLILLFLFENFTFHELSGNLFTEILGILFTIAVIDRIYDNKIKNEFKNRLIREMASNDNSISRRAIRELRANKWLIDKSLHGAYLESANLEGAELQNADLYKSILRKSNLSTAILTQANLEYSNLEKADLSNAMLDYATLNNANLREANLSNCDLSFSSLRNCNLNNTDLANANLTYTNLSNTKVSDEKLIYVRALRGAIMPIGKPYNGRFNLENDIKQMQIMINLDEIRSPAIFYGVPEIVYERGQNWRKLQDNTNIYSQDTEELYYITNNPDGEDLY